MTEQKPDSLEPAPIVAPAPARLTAVEVAELLGVTRQRVYQLRDAPDFPRSSGRPARWSRADIEQWADRRQLSPHNARSADGAPLPWREPVGVRLTATELERLDELAKAQGVPRATMARIIVSRVLLER